ncbi:Isoflavone 7-O-methyltransferase [Glycine max]|nr:Isoflavone 7-O-methyltransferase [Glycine max]
MTMTQDHEQLDSDLIATFVVERINSQFAYKVSYKKAWLAKQKAIAIEYGDWDESYVKLSSWLTHMQNHSPGSYFQILHDDFIVGNTVSREHRQFHRVFWTFGQCKEAFNYCKPIIQVDGSHLYGKYRGTLLMATSQDGNGGVLPLAFGVVKGETLAAWSWFLAHLREHVTDKNGICLISDRHASIKSAVANEALGWQPPHGYHVYCVRHIASNFNRKFNNVKQKEMLKKLVYTPCKHIFDQNLEKFRELSPAIATWIDRISKEKWTMAYDREGRRYGHMTTNLSECINKVLKDCRNIPITALVKSTYSRCRNYFVERGRQAQRQLNEGQVYCSKLVKELRKNQEQACTHIVRVYDIHSTRFEVEESFNPITQRGGQKWAINLNGPCGYVSMNYYQYIDVVYTNEHILKAYSAQWWPLGNEAAIPPSDDAWTLIPDPTTIRAKGWPKSTRIRNEIDWVEPSEHRTKCSRCGAEGHNRRRCPMQSERGNTTQILNRDIKISHYGVRDGVSLCHMVDPTFGLHDQDFFLPTVAALAAQPQQKTRDANQHLINHPYQVLPLGHHVAAKGSWSAMKNEDVVPQHHQTNVRLQTYQYHDLRKDIDTSAKDTEKMLLYGNLRTMCLEWVVQLGIPDIIHNHGKPITLSELVSTLQIPPPKAGFVQRFMRFLVLNGIFDTHESQEDHELAYALTPTSKLLVSSSDHCLSPMVRVNTDPLLMGAFHHFVEWIRGDDPSIFETVFGTSIWEYFEKKPAYMSLFNEAMASDSQMVGLALKNCTSVFEDLDSMVDVGGGTGTTARNICDAFPKLKCVVLDLPHVVENLTATNNLSFVGGDMFKSIPQASAVLLKWVLHDWDDEDCIKILEKCKDSISSKGNGGKVIIIDTVINEKLDDPDMTQTKLSLDIIVMLTMNGKERSEKEWKQLFTEAGFKHHKIFPIFGFRSLIELYGYLRPMCLKWAVQLGIPDIIHNHPKPITLSDLVSTLQIPPAKAGFVQRFMRFLAHNGIFEIHESQEEHELTYALTPASKLLVNSSDHCLSPMVLAFTDPLRNVKYHHLGEWIRGEDPSVFETAHGTSAWGLLEKNPEYFGLFNEAMASDSRIVDLALKNCTSVFEGLDSMVDVGGGTGTTARIICDAFPELKCVVLDLPHVVENLMATNNLSFVGGDMFKSIPQADAVLLKWVLHNWTDENCIKILKKCRDSISSKGNSGKVIIIDTVINEKLDDPDMTQTKLSLDIIMLTMNGRERTEKDWKQLFTEAGFNHYKIFPIFGFRSLIEVYP